jgi:hypothetical protein
MLAKQRQSLFVDKVDGFILDDARIHIYELVAAGGIQTQSESKICVLQRHLGFVAITIGIIHADGSHHVDFLTIEFGISRQCLMNDALFDLELLAIMDVLHLTAAAPVIELAQRNDPAGRCANDLDDFRDRIGLIQLHNLAQHGFFQDGAMNKNSEFIEISNPFSVDSLFANIQRDTTADAEVFHGPTSLH